MNLIQRYRLLLARTVITALVIAGFLVQPLGASAAALTSMSDTLTRLKAATAANHTLFLVTPTGVAVNQTITLTVPGSTFTGLGSVAFGDVDLAEGSTGTCSSASFTDKTLAASANTTNWGVSATSTVLTLTAPSTGTPITAGRCVRVLIGTNAVIGTTGTNQITNPAAGSYKITLTAGPSDSGSLAVTIITDDQVAITATVDPSLTFTLGANIMQFGTLSTTATRYANGAGGTTTEGGSGHSLTAGTNGTSGFVITAQGAVPTSGANTITAITTGGGLDPTASTGTTQFGLHLGASGGSGTVDADYSGTSPNKYFYGGTANTADTVGSSAGVSATTTYTIFYAANISAAQPPGAYSTTLTYIATATY